MPFGDKFVESESRFEINFIISDITISLQNTENYNRQKTVFINFTSDVTIDLPLR